MVQEAALNSVLVKSRLRPSGELWALQGWPVGVGFGAWAAGRGRAGAGPSCSLLAGPDPLTDPET